MNAEGHHELLPIEEWMEKYSEQNTLRYGSLGAAKLMAGYKNGTTSEEAIILLSRER